MPTLGPKSVQAEGKRRRSTTRASLDGPWLDKERNWSGGGEREREKVKRREKR
jgi:hypothetical protein